MFKGQATRNGHETPSKHFQITFQIHSKIHSIIYNQMTNDYGLPITLLGQQGPTFCLCGLRDHGGSQSSSGSDAHEGRPIFFSQKLPQRNGEFSDLLFDSENSNSESSHVKTDKICINLWDSFVRRASPMVWMMEGRSASALTGILKTRSTAAALRPRVSARRYRIQGRCRAM